MALEITDANLKEVLSTNELAVVDFWAPWCGPCRMLGPIVDELSTEITDVAIGKVNVESNAVASTEYGITSIPCLIFFKGGVEVDRVKGVLSKAGLKSKIEGLKN
jgi:thioredoxin 1